MGQHHQPIVPTPLPSTPRCEKCNARSDPKQGWCGRCGWYPRLEIFLELDPWDRDATPEEKAKKEEPNKLDAWKKLIPFWGWKMIAGVVVLLALTLAARFLLPGHGNIKFVWTVSQMVLGAVVLLGAHLNCYVYASLENDRLTPLDMIARPITIWMTVGSALPSTFWRVALAIWGLAAFQFAPMVGGFANRDLLDWGGHPARVSLVKAINTQAEKQAGDFNGLEGAIQNAAKEADSIAHSANGKQTGILVDCLILGFDASSPNDFESLVLAAEVDGKLRFVGTVSQGIDPEVRADLNKRMRKIVQANPFVPVSMTATWIKPMITCRVTAKEWSESHKLVRSEFLELLNELSVKQ